MASINRTRSQRIKKMATIGVATATATALTASLAPPPRPAPAVNNSEVRLAVATGPDYTQLVTDSSNSLNNILFTMGNIGGALAAVLDPLTATVPGGLLPTITATTTQDDLTKLADILDALAKISEPDLSGVPGLPDHALSALFAALLPELSPVIAPLLPALALLSPELDNVDVVLGLLAAIPLLAGVPSLEDLIGLKASSTVFDSTYDWPLLGLGTLLGLHGETSISNLFVQLPSLTTQNLVDNLLATLNGGLGLGPLQIPVDTVLGLLNPIATPSVTVWAPAAAGTYGLPLGGSFGFFSTMPVLDIGPVLLLSPDADTIVALPITAIGTNLPLNLAQISAIHTPGLVLPTATGVSTILGTTLVSLVIPGFGTTLTSATTAKSTYLGTNGISRDSGTTLVTLTTPFGIVPVTYSLGSFNLGGTGFGLTGPSLNGVGLFPSFQVGSVPGQTSPDGLIPASLINPLNTTPTQVTDLASILGLPNIGAAVSLALTPVFNSTVAPIGAQITSALDNAVGPLANGLSSGVVQLTGLIEQASEQLPGGTGPSTLTALASPQAEAVNASSGTPVKSLLVGALASGTTTRLGDGRVSIGSAAGDLHTSLDKANAQTEAAAKKARAQAQQALSNAHSQLNDIAAKGQKQIKAAADGVQKQVKDTAKKVSAASDKTGK